MKRYIFMTEEPSMEKFLNEFLPLHFAGLDFRVIPHEGKSDLEASIPRKLRAFRDYEGMEYRFVIIRDQDAGDCKVIKDKLKKLCAKAGRPESLIRIACKEMESWFLGELAAIEKAYGLKDLAKLQKRKKFRYPDKLNQPSKEIGNLLRLFGKRSYSKTMGAGIIAAEINPSENQSQSFQAFFTGVSRYLNEPE